MSKPMERRPVEETPVGGTPVNGKYEVFIIAAVAENGVIGAGDVMPWRLGSDLKRFKALTLGRPVIMGRRTFRALGRPLPDRPNIVVSRSGAVDAAPGVTVAASLEAALAEARRLAPPQGGEIAVIGGGEIYEAALPIADRLEITRVHAAPEGDVKFPPVDWSQWEEVAASHHPAGERDEHPFTFVTFLRR
jgi:dihydrofolate reductase